MKIPFLARSVQNVLFYFKYSVNWTGNLFFKKKLHVRFFNHHRFNYCLIKRFVDLIRSDLVFIMSCRTHHKHIIISLRLKAMTNHHWLTLPSKLGVKFLRDSRPTIIVIITSPRVTGYSTRSVMNYHILLHGVPRFQKGWKPLEWNKPRNITLCWLCSI